MVLKDHFTLQQQQMITQNPAPLQGGQTSHADASTSAHVLMMANETVALMTRAKTYDTPLEKKLMEAHLPFDRLPLLMYLMVLSKLRNLYMRMHFILLKEHYKN